MSRTTMIYHDLRRRELAQIHIAKTQLGMDDETYRAMLFSQGQVATSAALDVAGRRAVLKHLRASGFKTSLDARGASVPASKRSAHPGAPRNFGSADRAAMLGKVEALLADAKRPWSYADGMCKRMFNVDALTFVNPEQLHKLIAALEYDKKRREIKASAAEDRTCK